MSTYHKEWDCCDSVTETQGWEPEQCPFCRSIPQGDETATTAKNAAVRFDSNMQKVHIAAAQGDELPPLPEPVAKIDRDDNGAWGEIEESAWAGKYADALRLDAPLFTADQMREYGAACQAGRAADARDARRYRWLREADWSDIQSIYWSGKVQLAGTPEQCLAALDKEIDAARSSHTGGKDGN